MSREQTKVSVLLFIFAVSSGCAGGDIGSGQVRICLESEKSPIVGENSDGNIEIPLVQTEEDFDFSANQGGVRSCSIDGDSRQIVMMNDDFGLVQISWAVTDRNGAELDLRADLPAESGLFLLGTDQRGTASLELFDGEGVIVAGQSYSGVRMDTPRVERGEEVARASTDCGTLVESEFIVTHDEGTTVLKGGESEIITYSSQKFVFHPGDGTYSDNWICSEPAQNLSWFMERFEG